MSTVKAYFTDGTIREFDSSQEITKNNLWFTWDVMGRIKVFGGFIKPVEYYKEAGARDIKLVDAKGEIRKVPLWGSWLNDYATNLKQKYYRTILAQSKTWEEVDEKLKCYKEIEILKGQIRLLISKIEKLNEKLEFSSSETLNRHLIGLDKSLEEVGMR